ncbi:MAG TPA: threonine--tRNA ligase [Clostridiales bacterium]|nr:threonine--tRNA ligase [Clostridiales bacterium]HQP70419.1 threonine--tRNA ligase [Clostridiales bacterium]
MVKITFPDGKTKEYPESISGIEIAKSISPGLAKEVLCMNVDGRMCDLSAKIEADAKIKFFKFSDPEGQELYWHSTSHIMAQAVIRLFPGTRVAIGPAIEQGFYYDFEHEPFTDEDLLKIETEVNKIIKENQKFERKEVSRKEALEFFRSKNEIYKVELIEALPEDAVISMYTNGEFTDLCRGPHILSTGTIKKFKTLATSGAYWRGDSKNAMLQRIYGISFPSSEELEMFLKIREEAEKRDHRKLGRELDLFSFHQEAPGIPFYHHNGVIVKQLLIDYWRYEHNKDNYKEIQTPQLMTKSLWETSGHWMNYKDNMFVTEMEGVENAVKPMNCPGGMLWYKAGLHSYRELPMRISELGHVHRKEFSGALSGLFRVIAFTQDDAHIYMRPDQIKDEILGVIRLTDRIYKTFGLEYSLALSTRGEKYIGTLENWELATAGLKAALDEYGQDYVVNEGDAAFYGPKIDIYVKNALGKAWQCGTVQLDMNLPERFDLTYVDENSDKKRVIMIHRALYGSLERFLGIILEHFGGFFPLWLAPVQVSVMPVSDKFNDFAKEVLSKLTAAAFRVDFDERSEKIGYKIREAEGVKRIPYMLVIGEKERDTGMFTIRQHKKGNIGEFTLDSFIEKIRLERDNRALPEGYKLEL